MITQLVKKLHPIDINSLLNDFYKIEKSIAWTEYPQGKQASLQYKDGEDQWASGVGKMQEDEKIYKNLNDILVGTEFETVIKKYRLVRSRLMWVYPKSCYSFHNDVAPRIHIPLITNEECFFTFRTGEIFHLDTSGVWWTDTRKTHTFLNTSDHPRLHMVGALYV